MSEEYIKRNELVRDLSGTWNDDVIKMINGYPAADVEPVVRCKDCVAYAGKERRGGGIMMICRLNKREASPEHFCSLGRNRAHMERSGDI